MNWRHLALNVLCGFALLGPAIAAGAATRSSVSQSVTFDAFVDWDYRHRENLRAWRWTAIVVQRTLQDWYPQFSTHALLENGAPEDLQKFLRALPETAQSGMSVVYLTAHQSPAGEWDFPQRKIVSWNRVVESLPVPPHPNRIVIVDTCHAESIARLDAVRDKLGAILLLASPTSEETPEIRFFSRQPVDFARRYPAASTWLRKTLGREWDGRLSFLGFVWLQCYLETNAAPRNLPEWTQFLRRCETFAADFRKNVSRKASSRIFFHDATKVRE